MKNDLFSIGPLTVHGYGLMIAIGVLAAYFLGEYRAKKRKWDYDIVFGITMWAMIGGILGARLLYLIVDIKNVIANPKILLDFGSGLVIYGGLITGVLSVIVYCKFKKAFIPQWFDVLIPSVPLGQCFGRLGCFLSGCCYGAETDSWFSIVFKNSDYAPNNVHLYPSQLMSSAANLLHFILLMFVMPRFCKRPGQVVSSYMIFYSVGRFCIEFFRGDAERGAVGPFSTSQFISLFIFAGGIALFTFFTIKNYPLQDLTVQPKEEKEEKNND